MNDTLITNAITLLGVVIGGMIGFLTNYFATKATLSSEARKRIFELKKEAYYRLIKDATNWTNYALATPEQVEGQPDSPLLLKLRTSARMAQLVGNQKVELVIKEGWIDIGNWDFIEGTLIPALKDDIKTIEEGGAKH